MQGDKTSPEKLARYQEAQHGSERLRSQSNRQPYPQSEEITRGQIDDAEGEEDNYQRGKDYDEHKHAEHVGVRVEEALDNEEVLL